MANSEEIFEKIDHKNKITRSAYVEENNQIKFFKNQNFMQLKRECLRSGKLFVDPCFRPTDKSIYYSKPVPNGIKWMRPKDINSDARFIVNNANVNDLDQGQIGNCWFIAGCAAITFLPELFNKVVPMNQSFEPKEYTGMFHFRFWIHGVWYDVVIDDYLPVWSDKRLVFCHNKEEPNEFWSALLEKAYAKVCGGYENLEGGFTSDALIDMSGGIEESFNLKKSNDFISKDVLWKLLCESRKLKSMNAAFIEPDPYVYEAKMANGLIKGHAYTVTKINTLEINRKQFKLIRVRNPWGHIEWKGAWSDNAPEWNYLSKEEKERLEFIKENEGEFWMNFDDFYSLFDSVQFVHLTPDAFSDELKDNKSQGLAWKLIAYHEEWVPNKSAGGCGNGNDPRYWQNPQFLVKIDKANLGENQNMTTMIISLMQKYTREKRTLKYGQAAEEFIHFRLYRVTSEEDAQRAIKFGEKLIEQQLERVGNSGSYVNKREITKRFRVNPGTYLIIPSTFDYNVSGEFLLRIFTEKAIEDKNAHVLNFEKIMSVNCNTRPPNAENGQVERQSKQNTSRQNLESIGVRGLMSTFSRFGSAPPSATDKQEQTVNSLGALVILNDINERIEKLDIRNPNNNFDEKKPVQSCSIM